MTCRNYILAQKAVSLGCVVLVCFTCGAFCMVENFAKMQLFAILCWMFVLFFFSVIRYALANVNQISKSYSTTLCAWRLYLFNFVKFVTPVLTLVMFAASMSLLMLR